MLSLNNMSNYKSVFIRSPYFFMLIAIVSFCTLATCVKMIGNNIPQFELIFIRSIFGLIILIPITIKKLKRPSIFSIKQHFSRNIMHFIGQVGWILAIVHIGLAEAVAIEFSVPIWVLLITSFTTKNKFNLKNTIYTIIGFLGILLIVQPSKTTSFNSFYIVMILAAILYALTHIKTKELTNTYSSLDIVLHMIIIQGCLGFIGTTFSYTTPSLHDLMLLFIIGATGIIAHLSMTQAFKLSKNITTVLPLDYLRLPILILISALFFNYELKYSMILGSSLILISSWKIYNYKT